jgi:hypothetical protein
LTLLPTEPQRLAVLLDLERSENSELQHLSIVDCSTKSTKGQALDYPPITVEWARWRNLQV